MPSTLMNTLAKSLILFVFLSSCGRDTSPSSVINSASERFWQVSYPSDTQLDSSHTLMPYMRAAASRELPLRFFRELIQAKSAVSVVEGSWPSYRPGYFYGGTIYMPSSATPDAWSRLEWSSFYNELFHAWYGLVFKKQDLFAATRAQVQTEERMAHYRKAHPSDPELAQEEAWSETVAAIMIELTPVKMNDKWKYPDIANMKYAVGRTVSPVSHSDRPGYTPAAEETYPAEWEYAILFKLLTMVALPSTGN